MAEKQQLGSLPVGSIVIDKENNNKYIILETKYNITADRQADGMLLGLYQRSNGKFIFEDIVYDSDNINGATYRNSEIRNLFTNIDSSLEISDRLAKKLIPTMICVGPQEGETNSTLIGPDKIFLPSSIELGITTIYNDGVEIPTTNTSVNLYIRSLKSNNVLLRYSKGVRNYTADGTEQPIFSPANMVYFLCVDPTIKISKDEEDNFVLFDDVIKTKVELETKIQEATNLIEQYINVDELENARNNLQTVIDNCTGILNNATEQSEIDDATAVLNTAISNFNKTVVNYNIETLKRQGNIESFNELINDINDYINYINNNFEIEKINTELDLLNNLILEITTKKNNIENKIDPILDNEMLFNYLQDRYNTFYNIKNQINNILIVDDNSNNLRKQLGDLVKQGQSLLIEYPLIDGTLLKDSLNSAIIILDDNNAANSTLLNITNNLSRQISDFNNQKKFQLNVDNIRIETGSMGRLPAVKVVLINNTSQEEYITINNNELVTVNSPIILDDIEPLGSAKEYIFTGIKEGSTTATFTIGTETETKTITLPIIVIEKNTIDPTYFDLIDDVAKISLFQIEGGKVEYNNLNERLVDLENKVNQVSTTLDPTLINLLNIATPQPVINNIQNIIVKDADIETDVETIINVDKSYLVGQNHLLVYRNGVFQQVGLKYKELNNKQISFVPNYIKAGDRIILISSNIGDVNITKVNVLYNDNTSLNKITFLNKEEIIRTISFIYDTVDEFKMTQQIIEDKLYQITRDFIYNDNNLVSDVNFSIEII